MKTKIRLLLLGLFLLSTNVFSQDPNLYIYLAFGQSNMEGQGPIEAQDQTVDSRFQIMSALTCGSRTLGSLYTAVPPTCRCDTKLSPVDYFGRTMVANLPSNIKVCVINVAVAGCKIELFDKTGYTAYVNSGLASWMTAIINQYGGNPYGRLVQVAKLAQQKGVIKGILLHQGESNVGDNAWASKVKKIYTDLLTDLSLSAANVPLLAGEVVQANMGGISAGANTMIDALPNTIPTAYVISSSGLAPQSDNLHFSSASYRTFGTRYATKMLTLMGGLSVSTTSVSLAAAANSTGTFTISASTAWTVSSNQTWLTVSPASGSNNGTVTVTAQQNTGVSARSATVTVSATGVSSQTVTVTQIGTTVSINAGGSATGSFSADQFFSGGTVYTNTAAIDMSQITTNAPPAAIFNSERYGAMTYTIPNRTAGSTQTVTLYFAETYQTASAKRLFNVSINGTSVLSSFDIYVSAGGQNKAIAKTFSTTANSSGQVVIQFTTIIDNPKINGISVADGAVSNVPVTGVSINQANITIGVGATSQLISTVAPSNATNQSLSWSSSNTAVATVSATGLVTGVTTGTAIITVTTADGAKTATCSVTVNPVVVGSTDVYLEAECGTVGSLWSVQSGPTASNTTFATVIAGNNATASAPADASGWITYPFTVSAAGTYSVWFRTVCPDANGDSFWLKMDNGSFVRWNGITISTAWTWFKYTSTYSLTAGTHTFTVGYSEDGAKLDKIYITSSATTPSSTGSTAANLCTPVLKSASVLANNGIKCIYPNPVSRILNVILSASPSVISLYNSRGQQLLNINTEKNNMTIDMEKYLPGIYFLKITNSDQTSTEKIIKQ